MESKAEEKKEQKEVPENKEKEGGENKPLPTTFLRKKNLEYLIKLDKTPDKDSLGHYTSEHLRVSALYWGVGALNLINELEKRELNNDTVEYLKKCANKNGGYGGSIGQDSHITSTHYAILVLAQLGRLDVVDNEKVAGYIKSLQNPDGSFRADKYTETDSRFSYCAVAILKILGKLNSDYIDLPKATEYVLSCQNFDGGFGSIPGAESHGAYCFVCIGFLSVTNQLDLVDKVHTGGWLAERQTHLGGFNGRPEKLPDVCYSWWVLSSMSMIGTEGYFDKQLLIKFILECQDDEDGGIGDRPGNCPDVFHTFFGFCGLSLMGYEGLKKINPTYAIPDETCKKIGLI